MRIKWLVLAEGVTQDAKGALALVGLNQDVFGTEQLPAQTKRAVVARIVDLEIGDRYQFLFEVASPTGKILAMHRGEFAVGPTKLPIPGLPTTGQGDIPAEFQLAPAEYGVHKIRFELTRVKTGESIDDSVDLFVVDSPLRLGEPDPT